MSTAPKHTPGPWRMEAPKGTLTAWAIASERINPIAWVAHTFEDNTAEDANARLIAESPALLSELKTLRMVVAGAHSETHPEHNRQCPICAALNQSASAIARAEGGQL